MENSVQTMKLTPTAAPSRRYVGAVAICIGLLLATVLPSPSNAGQCLSPVGDVNGNGATNIVDVQCLILTSLWSLNNQEGLPPDCIAGAPDTADVNCDFQLSVVDVQVLVNLALGSPLSSQIDGDKDGCPDACSAECGDGVCEFFEQCATCKADCGSCTGSCCSAHPSIGCDSDGCTACVTNINDGCATSNWSGICSAIAFEDCADFCACALIPSNPPPGVLPEESKGSAVAITADDLYLLMVNSDDGSISVIDGQDYTLLRTIPVGAKHAEPTQLVIGSDDRTAYVTNKADGTVTRVVDFDTDNPQVGPPLFTGSEPVGLALTPTGATLYVANSVDGTISVVDTASWQVANTIETPGVPWAIAVTNDLDTDDSDETVFVTRFWSVPSGIEDEIYAPQSSGEGTDFGRKGLVYYFAADATEVAGSIDLLPIQNVGFDDPSAKKLPQGCFPNQLSSIALRKGRGYVVHTCAGPRGPVQFNVNMQGAVSVFEIDSKQELPDKGGTVNLNALVKNQSPENGGRQFINQPTDIAFIPNKTIAYVTAGGSNLILRINFATTKGKVEVGSAFNFHVPVGGFPQGTAVSHDGKRFFSANLIGRSLSAVVVATQSVVATTQSTPLPVDGTDEHTIWNGKRFFNTATKRWSKESWGSCVSCHPGGLSDNVTWHFAAGPRQSTSLDGSFSKSNPADQRIFNWTAIFDEVADFEANTRGVSGGKGAITDANDNVIPLNAAIVNGSTQNHQQLNGSAEFLVDHLASLNDWNEIKRYMQTIRAPRGVSNQDPDKVAMGRLYFELFGCTHCHSGPKWTISTRYYTPSVAQNDALKTMAVNASTLPAGLNTDTIQLGAEVVGGQTIAPPRLACAIRNVGTFGDAAVEVKADMTSKAQGQTGYNIPSLLGLAYGAPYFHHGAAETLHDLFSPAFAAHHQAYAPGLFDAVDINVDEAESRDALIAFLLTIDDTTEPFPIPEGAQICPDLGEPPPAILPGESKGSSVAVTPNGKWVAMVNTDLGTVSIVNAETASLSHTAIVGNAESEPSQVVAGPDSKTFYVTNKGHGTVVKITLNGALEPTLSAPLATGSECFGLGLSPSGRRLYVANTADGTVSVVDTAAWTKLMDITTPGLPWAVAVTNDLDGSDNDESVFVTRFWSVPSGIVDPTFSPQSGGEGTDFGRKGVVYKFGALDSALSGEIDLLPIGDVGFTAPTGPAVPQGCFPNQLAGIALHNGRGYVVNTCAGPRGPVNFNVNVQGVVSVFDLDTLAEDLSDVGTANLNALVKNQSAENGGRQFVNLPLDIAFIPETNEGYVVATGSNLVLRLVYDMATNSLSIGSAGALHIPVGSAPTGIAISPNGKTAYVANEIARTLSIIDLTQQSVTQTIQSAPLPTPGTEAADVLNGKKFFNTATKRWSKESWGSCVACHPGGLSDNVTWHFAAGPRQSTSLDGSFSKTDPTDQRIFNWTAIFDEVADFELNTRGVSGGKGAITDAGDNPIPLNAVNVNGVIENHQGLSGSTEFVVDNLASLKDWNEIRDYMRKIRPPKAPSNLDPALVEAGRQRFEDAACHHCHGGAKWTISKRFYTPSLTTNASLTTLAINASSLPPGQNENAVVLGAEVVGGTTIAPPRIACVLRNVGTFGDPALEKKADMTSIAQGQKGYNPPSLLGLVFGAPYLHDGSAETLEDLFSEKYAAHHQANSPGFLAGVDTDPVAQQAREELIAFLKSIDTTTVPFEIPPGAVICP